MKNKTKGYLLRKWLGNYYSLYKNRKTPTDQDIVKAIRLDLRS